MTAPLKELFIGACSEGLAKEVAVAAPTVKRAAFLKYLLIGNEGRMPRCGTPATPCANEPSNRHSSPRPGGAKQLAEDGKRMKRTGQSATQEHYWTPHLLRIALHSKDHAELICLALTLLIDDNRVKGAEGQGSCWSARRTSAAKRALDPLRRPDRPEAHRHCGDVQHQQRREHED